MFLTKNNRLLDILMTPTWPDNETPYMRKSEFGENGAVVYKYYLPGFKKDEVQVSVKRNSLAVTADKAGKRAVRDYLEIDEDYDAEKITAKLEDGVLTVTCPASESSKPKIIKIE